MVGSATSLGRNGVHDWLLQRVSAIILGLYSLCVVSFIWLNPGMDFSAWQTFITHPAMKIFTLITLLAMLMHAWVGLWTVATDYIKPTSIRLVFEGVVIITCFALLAWGVMIIWGF